MVRHHFDPVTGLQTWDRSEFIVPPRPDLDAKLTENLIPEIVSGVISTR